MKTLREQMLQEMQLRNYSERTISCYLSCLTSLSRHYNQSPDKISIEKVKEYLHYLIVEKGFSRCMLNQTISALKILHKDVLNRSWDPLKIQRPRREKRLPLILSKQEVISIVNTPVNLKHRAILMLGYSAGLRISEVTNLKVRDIDSKRMQIRIEAGKGKKDRNTILSPTLLSLLRDYCLMYRPQKWLFEGWSPTRDKYSETSIRKLLSRACLEAGISKPVTYHTLRHCFATHLLEQGTNLQIIQQLLGHSNITTTCTYLHVQQHTIDKVVSPIDVLP